MLRQQLQWCAALVMPALIIPGCGSGVVVMPDGDVVDGNRDGTLFSSLGKTSGEPNDSFTNAVVAVFEDDGVMRLQGTIVQNGDLDVFMLGGLDAGDRVIVDTDTTGSVLDVSIALFDAEMRLVVNNDDRTLSNLDAYVDWIA